MAAEKVQPVPCVLPESIRGALNAVNSRPFQRRSIASPLRWPPLTST